VNAENGRNSRKKAQKTQKGPRMAAEKQTNRSTAGSHVYFDLRNPLLKPARFGCDEASPCALLRLFQVEILLGFFPWDQRLGTVLGNGLFEIAQIFKLFDPFLEPCNGGLEFTDFL
jgi:hypothetical protein